MIQVKRFFSIDSCNAWLIKNKETVKVVNGSLAIGPSGSNIDTEVLIIYEIDDFSTQSQGGKEE